LHASLYPPARPAPGSAAERFSRNASHAGKSGRRGRVALFVRRLHILIQPMLDRRNKRVQLRPSDRRLPLIAGRCRIRHHLGNAVARYVEMLRCLTPHHPFRDRQANLEILIPRCRSPVPAFTADKEIGGRILLRPQQDYPAATVGDFCTAALSAATSFMTSYPSSITSPLVGVTPKRVFLPRTDRRIPS